MNRGSIWTNQILLFLNGILGLYEGGKIKLEQNVNTIIINNNTNNNVVEEIKSNVVATKASGYNKIDLAAEIIMKVKENVIVDNKKENNNQIKNIKSNENFRTDTKTKKTFY